MSGAAFDTHAAVKALRDAELGERQAEAITAVVRRATSADRDNLATKADLEAVKAEVNHLEARIEARIERAEKRMLLGMLTVGGLIVAAIKLL